MKPTNWNSSGKRYDWSVVEANPPPPAAGTYSFTVDRCEPRVSKSGNNYFSLWILLRETSDGEKCGRFVSDNIVLSEASGWKMKQVLDCLQIEGPEDDSLDAAEDFCRRVKEATKDGSCFLKLKHVNETGQDGSTQTKASVAAFISAEKMAEAAQ